MGVTQTSPWGGKLVADMNADTSAEALAQVLAVHAETKWGASKADALQDRLVQTAQTLLDLRRRLPGTYTEPGCYPAAESSGPAGQR